MEEGAGPDVCGQDTKENCSVHEAGVKDEARTKLQPLKKGQNKILLILH